MNIKLQPTVELVEEQQKVSTISNTKDVWKNYFFPKTIPEWNKLPNETVNIVFV